MRLKWRIYLNAVASVTIDLVVWGLLYKYTPIYPDELWAMAGLLLFFFLSWVSLWGEYKDQKE